MDADLAPFGAKVFSQFEEDGILAELTRRLGIHRGVFVEIGVGDGHENNTRALVDAGWRGCWLGDEPAPWTPHGVVFRQATVTPENVCELLADAPRPIDVLSIDIDGNDYWVAEAIVPALQPRIVIVEFNQAWEGPYVMPYCAGYHWHVDMGIHFGASLTSWCDLLMEYDLVYTTEAKVNAFFVRQAC